MRYIDAFNHFNPKRYHEGLLASPADQKDIGKRVRGIPALWDYTQVLSLGMPMVDRLWGPDKSPEMAKIANDGLAEVVAKHPDRFVGYSAVVPMNAPSEAAKEAERALRNGANAVQMGTNVNGGPIDGERVCRSVPGDLSCRIDRCWEKLARPERFELPTLRFEA